jgi:hypothetical protein
MEGISDFLRSMPGQVDPEMIINEAVKIPLRTKLLDDLERNYYEVTGKPIPPKGIM